MRRYQSIADLTLVKNVHGISCEKIGNISELMDFSLVLMPNDTILNGYLGVEKIHLLLV